MSKELEQLIHRIEECYNGSPWYGKSMFTLLNEIEASKSGQMFGDKSIYKLLDHMVKWRVFTYQKLIGNFDFSIDLNSESDWQDHSQVSMEQWSGLKSELEKTQNQILDKLKNDPPNLDDKVMGSQYDYNFRYMLEGLIQHDIYHLGQIALLAKM